MKLKGKVIWYDKVFHRGLIKDTDGTEYHVEDQSSLIGPMYLEAHDDVTFEIDPNVDSKGSVWKVDKV